MKVSYIPKELLHIILDYDGRIKYKNGKYVNIIHKNDFRYNIIQKVVLNKLLIIKDIDLAKEDFYFEINFDIDKKVGLYYDYNLGNNNILVIGFYDTRNGFKQIKTYL
jgi:hypothetical protein